MTKVPKEQLDERLLTVTQIPGIVLLQANWTLVSGLYEYTYSNAAITDISIVDIVPDNADIPVIKIAEIYPKTESAAGTVKMFSLNQPTTDITVTVNIYKN